VASITGVALEPAGGAVTVGQLSPGGVLESARYVVATVPTAPTNLKTGYGNGKVTLTWGAPASDGGSVITGYNVYEGTSAGGESTKPVNSSPLAATARGYTVSGLKNGTRYYFKARALNTLGTSPPSNEASAVPRTEPGAPGSLKAVAGNAKVTLSWTPPASDGGSPVTGYDVYEGTKPGGESTKPVNSSPISSSAKSYGVSSLKNHTKYYFKVKAINSVGIGASSNEASATPV
jgi:predicted phage tail protein